MSIPCLTFDGHYVELDKSEDYFLRNNGTTPKLFYFQGTIFTPEFPDGIVSLWDVNHDNINNPNLNIARFQVGPEDREFQIRKEQALEYRKVTNESR